MWHSLTWEATAVCRSIRRCVTAPGPERYTAVQSLKAAGAALLAWALAGWWWNAPMALLAPWTALFLVQSTVYRSLLSALQQFVVVVAGTLLAAGAGALTHNTMAAMSVALPLTVLLGNYTRFGSQGLYAPTAALFVLAYGSYAGFDILHRLLETLLGAAIGVCVNALVLPPVHADRVRHLRNRLPRDCAALLRTIADGIEGLYDDDRVRGWYDRAVRLTDVVAELRDARRWSDESYRFNPGHKLRRTVATPPSADWDLTWDRITEHIRATIRTLHDAATLPDCVPGLLASLMRSAGDVLAPDAPGAPGDRARALDEATAAHRRLTAVLADGRYETTPALGGLTLDTQRLLDDLATVTTTTAVRAQSAPRPRTAGRES
ncbi:FUSC family protein [Streptomyces blattellae]|uniref:FUSC family protein n=1 Tax=Streptomyces blattellae TaxID=2569855 RepID=UPI0012B9D6E3|nr:FUSC family protein [Streptomyces blattellae]